jgi:hypothetical protein
MENPVLLKCDRTKRGGEDKRKAQVDFGWAFLLSSLSSLKIEYQKLKRGIFLRLLS